MDTTTLLICSALVSGIMTLFIGALYLTSKEEKYLYDWVISGLFFFLASMLGLYGNIIDMPAFIYQTLNNALYVCAHALIYTGVKRLTKAPNQTRMLSLLFGLIVMVQFIPTIQDSLELRILVLYPIIAFFNIISIVQLWRYRYLEFSKAFYLFAFSLMAFVVQSVLEFSYYLSDAIQSWFGSDEVLRFTGDLSLIAFIFLLTLSMTIVVTWKKELKLYKLSRTDTLTAWNNRRALELIAQQEFDRAARLNSTVGFIIMDIDHFKRINDQYGHQVGDYALLHFCRTVEKANREYDYNFRLGGEEFAILVTDTTEDKLIQIAERIRFLVEQSPLQHKGDTISMTTSIGIAMSNGKKIGWDKILNQADKAVYQSKQRGRNTTSVFEQSIA